MTLELLNRLQSAAEAADDTALTLVGPVEDIAELTDAPEPIDGSVDWTPPSSYASWMAEHGPFTLSWFSPALDGSVEVTLLDADGIAEMSEMLYVPEGVSMEPGVDLTTNHLVPFASVGYEGAFCFDVTAGPHYPVFYNHPDNARFRVAETGEWDNSTPSEPDFVNFEAWLEWLVSRLEDEEYDPEGLGQPWFRG